MGNPLLLLLVERVGDNLSLDVKSGELRSAVSVSAAPCSIAELGARISSPDWYNGEKVAWQVALFERESDRIGLVHSSAFAVYPGGRMVDMRGQYVPAQAPASNG